MVGDEGGGLLRYGQKRGGEFEGAGGTGFCPKMLPAHLP